jgi:hypothetical protein
MHRLVMIGFVVSVALATIAPTATAANAPVRLSFDKVAVAPGMWQGTVSGDIAGDLATQLLSLDVTGPIWHVTFDWRIEAGPSSFTARLSEILNTETGGVVMDGTVVTGYLLGARVHEEGQLIDPLDLEFVGSIRVAPATAG